MHRINLKDGNDLYIKDGEVIGAIEERFDAQGRSTATILYIDGVAHMTDHTSDELFDLFGIDKPEDKGSDKPAPVKTAGRNRAA